MAENIPNVLKENVIQAQEAQKLPSKINSKRPTRIPITIKMSKVKDKILKVAEEKK